MTVTITTPAGSKVRSASRRRFVVVAEEFETNGTAPRAFVVKRSDSVTTARAEVARRGGPVWAYPDGSRVVFHVADTATGEFV